MRSAIGMVWSCQGASPSSPSPDGPCSTAAPCSADSGAEPSVESKPAKKPFSHERCASENGALDGMISILGGGVIWFMRRPPHSLTDEASRRRGGAQKSGRFHQVMPDATDTPS